LRLLRCRAAWLRALGQQGISRNILSGDVTAFKQRDCHADFVGALQMTKNAR
jgi:hypothetical protein